MKKFFKKVLDIIKTKLFWIIVVSLAIVMLLATLFYGVYRDIKKETKADPIVEETGFVEAQFGEFILYSDTTPYQKDLFKLLEETPAEGQVEAYIDIYAKNFLADFLTLSVKDTNLKRVGGRRYIHAELQDRYVESNGVSDYYTVRDYMVSGDESLDVSTLPEVTMLEQVAIEPITYDFTDANHVIPERLGLSGYSVTYNITYASTNLEQFSYDSEVTLKIVNWDGVWTVVEVEFGYTYQ